MSSADDESSEDEPEVQGPMSVIRNIAVWNQGVKHQNFTDSIIIGIEKPLQMHRKCIINFEINKKLLFWLLYC